MSHALLAPELEYIPNRYPLPVEAYYRLMDLGFLEGRFEVLDGEVINKMGQNPPHAVTLTILMRVLAALFGPTHIRVQAPIAIPGAEGVYNEPEPDLTVTRAPEGDFVTRHPGPDDLHLVIEVSDTTLRMDLILKARLYARAGVAEYWSLDLPARRLHVHRQPSGGEYSSVTILSESDTVAILSRPETPIAVADLLPPTTA